MLVHSLLINLTLLAYPLHTIEIRCLILNIRPNCMVSIQKAKQVKVLALGLWKEAILQLADTLKIKGSGFHHYTWFAYKTPLSFFTLCIKDIENYTLKPIYVLSRPYFMLGWNYIHMWLNWVWRWIYIV